MWKHHSLHFSRVIRIPLFRRLHSQIDFMDQNLIPCTPVPNDSYPDLPMSPRMGNYFSPHARGRSVLVAERDPVKYRVEQPAVATGAYRKRPKTVPQVVAST